MFSEAKYLPPIPLITKLLYAVHRRKLLWAYRIVEAEQQREQAWMDARYEGLSTEELAKRVNAAPEMGGATVVELSEFAENRGRTAGSRKISFEQSPVEPAAPTAPVTDEAVKELANKPNVRFPTLRDKDL
jgi:hypothetical protein